MLTPLEQEIERRFLRNDPRWPRQCTLTDDMIAKKAPKDRAYFLTARTRRALGDLCRAIAEYNVRRRLEADDDYETLRTLSYYTYSTAEAESMIQDRLNELRTYADQCKATAAKMRGRHEVSAAYIALAEIYEREADESLRLIL